MLAGFFMALLPLCSAAGLLYLPFLLLWFGFAAFTAWRSPDVRGKRTSLVIGGWMCVAVSIVLLYFWGYDRGVSHAYMPAAPNLPTAVETILAVVTSPLGPTAVRFWPDSGRAMLLLLLLSAGVLIRAVWSGRPENARGRALGLLAGLCGAMVLAAGLGWGRAAVGYQQGFIYPTLAVLLPCLVYLAWGFDRSPLMGRGVQTVLFFCVCLVAYRNIPQWLAAGEADHEARSAFERDLRGGAPGHLLVARHSEALGLSHFSLEQSLAKMQMLKRAGVGSFGHMHAEPPMRAVSIPLTPTQLGDAELDRGVVLAAHARSFLTFTLPEPMYVAAIRIQCGAPSSSGPFKFGAGWHGGNDAEVPRAHSFFYGFPVSPLTFAVADTIEKIRIYPNVSHGPHPFHFPLTKLEVLVPETREPQSSAGRTGAVEPARR
jgi:hypothetical protein